MRVHQRVPNVPAIYLSEMTKKKKCEKGVRVRHIFQFRVRTSADKFVAIKRIVISKVDAFRLGFFPFRIQSTPQTHAR